MEARRIYCNRMEGMKLTDWEQQITSVACHNNDDAMSQLIAYMSQFMDQINHCRHFYVRACSAEVSRPCLVWFL